jgi:flagellin
MSTFTSGINQSLSNIESADQAATRLSQQLSSGRKIQTAEDDPSTWLEASRADSTSTYLDAVHTGLQEVSTDLSVVNTAMQAIGGYLSSMQGQLQQALSYPAGDPNRQQYIANYNTILQQIDQTVNTESQAGARNLMSDPATDPQAGNLQVLVGLNGQTRTVHAQEVDTGPNGLNVPALDPATATDADVQAALTSLTSAQSTLASRQMVLGADTADIQDYTTQVSATSGLYQTQVDALTTGDPSEAAAELQSVNVQRSLAVSTMATISTSRQAILALLQ